MSDSSELAAFANRLKKLRNERDWSQRELAVRAGIDQGTVSKFERGAATNPEHTTILALAGAFGVKPGDLLGPLDGDQEERAPASDALPTAFLEFMRGATGRGLTGEQLDAIHSKATAKRNTRGYALADFEQAYRDLYVVREDKRTESKAQATEVDAKKTEGLKKIDRKKGK